MPSATPGLPAAQDVVDFWVAAGPSRWFRKDDAFDAQFRERFLAAHEATAGTVEPGRSAAEALARLLLLDQFPRNAFRGRARAFATDPLARLAAAAALRSGHDGAVEPALRNFFYLPFMHSEWLPDQERALALCAPLGREAQHHARVHHDIVARFGRFPHRNALLGRTTTAAEQAFLDEGGFAG